VWAAISAGGDVGTLLPIVQAVSRWRLTAVTHVPTQVSKCGICGGQSGNESGFLTEAYFDLPCQHHSTDASYSFIYQWRHRLITFGGRGESITGNIFQWLNSP
jgi:hypothetical protein